MSYFGGKGKSNAHRMRKPAGMHRWIVLILVASLLLGMTPSAFSEAVYAAAAEKAYTWYVLKVEITSTWDEGISGELTLANIGNIDREGWQICLPWQVQITSIWNGTYEQHKGWHYLPTRKKNVSYSID